jgi:hypothetical protein
MGFDLSWRFRSRESRLGRRKTDAEVSEAIKLIALENPTWGASKIHGELSKLGFDVAERTVSRYLASVTLHLGDAAQRWRAFLRNHRDDIVAIGRKAPKTAKE